MLYFVIICSHFNIVIFEAAERFERNLRSAVQSFAAAGLLVYFYYYYYYYYYNYYY